MFRWFQPGRCIILELRPQDFCPCRVRAPGVEKAMEAAAKVRATQMEMVKRILNLGKICKSGGSGSGVLCI